LSLPLAQLGAGSIAASDLSEVMVGEASRRAAEAGIATSQGLAEASAERLVVQLGRLERSLLGGTTPAIDRAKVQRWIANARRRSGRPGN
jgi:hypothetical protein